MPRAVIDMRRHNDVVSDDLGDDVGSGGGEEGERNQQKHQKQKQNHIPLMNSISSFLSPRSLTFSVSGRCC